MLGNADAGNEGGETLQGFLKGTLCGREQTSGLAPCHPRATMQKHEKKRVAGGASCNCLKIKGQICNHERGNLEVASDSWREKEEEKEMKWRTGEGVASVANTRLTGARFGICGNDWSYGRFFGSVANTGLSDILEEGRTREGRGEKYRAAGAHGACGAGYRQSRVRIAEAIVLHLDCLSSDK